MVNLTIVAKYWLFSDCVYWICGFSKSPRVLVRENCYQLMIGMHENALNAW